MTLEFLDFGRTTERLLLVIYFDSEFTLFLDHFRIHCNKLINDSTNSWPFEVSLYSTLGGISLYACLSNIPLFSNSLSVRASVLLLKPFNYCLNCLCLTGSVEQQSGISISRVPLFVISLRSFAVSDINIFASYPSKLHSL